MLLYAVIIHKPAIKSNCKLSGSAANSYLTVIVELPAQKRYNLKQRVIHEQTF
jgi:hypothetical protein